MAANLEKKYEEINFLLKYLYRFPAMQKETLDQILYFLKPDYIERQEKEADSKLTALDQDCERSWNDFFRELKAFVKSEVVRKREANYQAMFMRFNELLKNKINMEYRIRILRKSVADKKYRLYFDEEKKKFLDNCKDAQNRILDELDRLSGEYIEEFENPFSHTGENGSPNFNGRPVARILQEKKEYLGYEQITLKTGTGREKRFRYPVVANRDNLIIISYQFDDNPKSTEGTSANSRAYETVANYLSNICFQEMCRNLDEKNNFTIHCWSENETRININNALRWASVDLMKITGKQYLLQDENLDDCIRKWSQKTEDDGFDLAIVFYSKNSRNITPEKLAELAALRRRNVFTVCICRAGDLDDFRQPLTGYDSASLLDASKTPVFSSDHIELGTGGVLVSNLNKFHSMANDIVAVECFCEPQPNISRTETFKTDNGGLVELKMTIKQKEISCQTTPVLSSFEKDRDFMLYSLRTLVFPPSDLPAGTVKMPIGELKGFPQFLTYLTGQEAQNAFLYGHTGTGKTAWLIRALFYLAENYTPNEVNIYLCSFDKKGYNDFSVLCKRIPHIVLSVISQKPITIQILMNKIQAEHNARNRSFARLANYLGDISISDLDQYKEARRVHNVDKSMFPDYPTIVMFLDESSCLKTDGLTSITEQFEALMRVIRNSGIFFILASQIENDLPARMMAMIPNTITLEVKTTNPVTRVEVTWSKNGNRKETVRLDDITYRKDKESDKRYQAEKADTIKRIFNSCKNNGFIPKNNMFVDGQKDPDSRSDSPPKLDTLPISEDNFKKTIASTEKNCLCLFGGISFGRNKETCFTDPFFLTLRKGNDGNNKQKHCMVVGQNDEATDSFWLQIINSITIQNRSKCRFVFYNSFSEEPRSELLKPCSAGSVLVRPQSIKELLEETALWQKQANRKEGDPESFDFTILAINLTKVFEDFKELAEEEAEAETSKSPAESPKETSPEEEKRKRLLELARKYETGIHTNQEYKAPSFSAENSKPASSSSSPQEKKKNDKIKTFADYMDVLYSAIIKTRTLHNGAYVFLQSEGNPQVFFNMIPAFSTGRFNKMDEWLAKFCFFCFTPTVISTGDFAPFSALQRYKSKGCGFYFRDNSEISNSSKPFSSTDSMGRESIGMEIIQTIHPQAIMDIRSRIIEA